VSAATAGTQIIGAVGTLFEPSAVVELRAFSGRCTVSGYFDDHEALVKQAHKLDEQGYAVYVTLNEVDPALLARAANKVNRYPKATTSDMNILRRRWLPVDFDPVRPADISSTDEEKKAALLRAQEVRGYLAERGWPEPVVGDSGNGAHLLYSVDLPNDRENLELVTGVLEALSFKFSEGTASVDTTTANAARIWKLYGTTARKGDDTEERPHRASKLLKAPGEIQIVSGELLLELARSKPQQPRAERNGDSGARSGVGGEWDLAGWLAAYGVPVKREGPWGANSGGYRYVLEECPWNGHTDNAAYLVQFGNGAIAAGCHHNSCQGYGWRELREHFEPGAYERNGSRSSYSSEPDDGNAFWEEPVALPEGLPPVMNFDLQMLPSPLRGWITDVAERMQIPPDFCAAGAVVVAGSLIGRKFGIIGRKFGISPKRHDDWIVVPNLWGAAVGRPAMLKSPALAEIMKPLDRLVAEAREEYEREYAAYEREASMHRAEAKAREKDLEAAREAVKSGDRSKLEKAADRQRDAGGPEEPEPRRYKTEDPTVEKLCDLLISNPQGILVHRDELSGWLRSLDKQGRESDRSLYLEAWNGTGSYEVDRIGRGSLYVPALCVSILGGIQPGPLSSYVWEATQGAEGNDGLLQRFQLLVWPDSPKTWRNVDRYPDSVQKNRAFEVIVKLDALTAEGFGAVAEDEDAIPTIRFTWEAQAEFDAFREGLEHKLRSGELSGALEAHLAKYRSLFPALALLFAAMDYVDGQSSQGTVSQECALRAWAWCEYLESHARRLYSSAEDPAMEGARALLQKIEAGDVADGASGREVYRRQWSRLTTPEEFTAAASVPEAYGWIRLETVKTGGRSTTKLHLHPGLRGEV
jgi:hypothetical protein